MIFFLFVHLVVGDRDQTALCGIVSGVDGCDSTRIL